MHYMGGKSRIAKPLAAVMLAATSARTTYVEPFVGAGSVAAQMVPHFEHAYLSDTSPDLIALWRALQDGWEPPAEVSEELYRELRHAPVSALRGFVGYGCSFGGKWFGGYAYHSLTCCGNADKTFALHSAGALAKKIKRIGAASFSCLSYFDAAIPHGSVMYCDPPYQGTTKYAGASDFDNGQFWKWAEAESACSSVFVSEYSAPDGWRSVWSGTPQASLGLVDKTARASEHLYTFQP